MPAPCSKWPRARRLLQRPDFVRAYAAGKRRSSSHFTVFVTPQETTRPSRFGITVSRKLGVAVVRNRIRRRTRELLRCLAADCPPGWAVVINPRASMLQAAMPVLAVELRDLLRRCAGVEAGRTA